MKKTIIAFLSVICVIIVSFFLFDRTSDDVWTLHDIEKIQIFHDGQERSISDQHEIDKLMKILGSIRLIDKESVDDTPRVKQYDKIVFTYRSKEEEIVYFYVEKGKAILERPYVGIYQVSDELKNWIDLQN